jgi:hypothetical protein
MMMLILHCLSADCIRCDQATHAPRSYAAPARTAAENIIKQDRINSARKIYNGVTLSLQSTFKNGSDEMQVTKILAH